MRRLFCVLSLALGFSFNALADSDPTPTATPVATETAVATATATPSGSATATPTPSACQSLQACVDSSVDQAVASCAASNPNCPSVTDDRFAVTATQLANRAINKFKCTDRKRRSNCNLCYAKAKSVLRMRYDLALFHGIGANAVAIIEGRRKVQCLALTNGNQGNRGNRGEMMG